MQSDTSFRLREQSGGISQLGGALAMASLATFAWATVPVRVGGGLLGFLAITLVGGAVVLVLGHRSSKRPALYEPERRLFVTVMQQWTALAIFGALHRSHPAPWMTALLLVVQALAALGGLYASHWLKRRRILQFADPGPIAAKTMGGLLAIRFLKGVLPALVYSLVATLLWVGLASFYQMVAVRTWLQYANLIRRQGEASTEAD